MLAFEPRLQPCVCTFTNLLVAAVRHSAAALDPHDAHATRADSILPHPPILINHIYHTHQSPKIGPDQLDHFLDGLAMTIKNAMNILALTCHTHKKFQARPLPVQAGQVSTSIAFENYASRWQLTLRDRFAVASNVGYMK